MKNWRWQVFLLGLIAVYTLIYLLIGFNNMAAPIQFCRVAIAAGCLVLYFPKLHDVLKEWPIPRRDYFYIGLMLVCLSSVSFAILNELGQLFGVDGNIRTSPVAGLFSVELVIGILGLMIGPDLKENSYYRIVALVCGLLVATAIVVIAPLFR